VTLYVCYGTFGSSGHPCAKAHQALREAGHDPEVVRVYGGFVSNPLFPGRRKVKELSGSYHVPTLVLDDGTVVDESGRIADWAAANPAA
jgi:glutathione S-transferase